ncbi:hypothetical protein AVEN_103069-1 [Araneus ventricosus]|uniref:Uncharacterized protein n=1 Tax=Araneus ventricosus TaxID=182803 RepID=A0A4Y2BAH7_ARAVE|nr:hypothetical protein AVEN_103069-1 [Araneus ventricosus]
MSHQPARYTGGSHLDVLSAGAPPVDRIWMSPIVMRATGGSHLMSHQSARATGGSHLDVPSVGACHRWIAFGCPISRRVPPVDRVRTWMSHQSAHTTGGSHSVPSSARKADVFDVPSVGAPPRWTQLNVPGRRCVPLVDRIDVPSVGAPPVDRIDDVVISRCATGGSHWPSVGAYHRWIALGCPISRRVPPVDCTDVLSSKGRATGGSHLNVPSVMHTTGDRI